MGVQFSSRKAPRHMKVNFSIPLLFDLSPKSNMAETLLFGVAESFIRKLASRAVQETSLALGVYDDLREIRNTVSLIKAVLLDAEQKQQQNHELREWLRQIKRVFSDAEDVIDDFEWEALRKQVVNTSGNIKRKVRRFFKSSNPFICRLRMVLGILAIKEGFDKVAADRHKFGLQTIDSDNRVVQRRELTHSHVNDSDVIGREHDDKQKIKKLLLQANSQSQHSNCTPMSRVFLPDELVAEVLSLLPVESLMRLKCVSKSWNTLISDPTFVKMHLMKSTRNTHLTMFISKSICVANPTVLPFHIRRLPTLADNCRGIVGSCNGLLCLRRDSVVSDYVWFSFWNPATRERSGKLGTFCAKFGNLLCNYLKFMFGYDNSTNTYKIVAVHSFGNYFDKDSSWISEVKVFSLGDNVWRSIQSLHVIPLRYSPHPIDNDAVYFTGTLNWLALRINDSNAVTVEQVVIISLDLHTETCTQLLPPPATYRQLLPPRGFENVPHVKPTLGTLMDCLCFSHDFEGTHFVIWKMTEFGVEDSWTQLFKISYQTLQIYYETLQNGDQLQRFHSQLFPLCLSKNDDTLILANDTEGQSILYNWRDNRVVKKAKIDNGMWRIYLKDYVESLVSTC